MSDERFCQVVRAYKTASQEFIREYETMIMATLSFAYTQESDERLHTLFGLDKTALNKGIAGLIQENNHPRIYEFYQNYSNVLELIIATELHANNPKLNLLLAFRKIYERGAYFRADIEQNDLEYEISLNADLPNDYLVKHLLRLRGPFGCRAYTANKQHAPLTPTHYPERIIFMMDAIQETTINYLKEQETAPPSEEPPEDEKPYTEEPEF